MARERYLGVPSRTPNKMACGELGRYPLFKTPSYLLTPLFIALYVRWFHLLHMEQRRLPNQDYRMLVNLDENGKMCCTTEVQEILCKAGFYFVWLQQGV